LRQALQRTPQPDRAVEEVENSHRLFEDSDTVKDAHDRQIEALNREVEALTADYEFLKTVCTFIIRRTRNDDFDLLSI